MPALVGGQVDELAPGLWRVVAPNPSFMTGTGTNSYLLGGPARGGAPGGVAVVDAGPDDPAHLERLLDVAPGPVRYLLVTHHHRDHAPGAVALRELTGATLLARGGRPELRPDGELRDGDTVAVPGWRLEALETPGHASDHLAFLARRPDGGELVGAGELAGGAAGLRLPLLFSGDHVLGGTTVVVPPPDGDMAAYLASLRRLLALEPPVGTVAPGHGELVADPPVTLQRYLAHRLEREEQVVEELRALGSARPGELVDRIYTTRPGPLHDAAALSVWAHLRKLAGDGRARALHPDDPASSWTFVPDSATGRARP